MPIGNGPEGLPVYVDSLGDLVWVDTTGTINLIATGSTDPLLVTKSYSFQSPVSTGEFFVAGFYDLTAADLNLTQAATTGTAGSANVAYGAHAILVAGGVGAASGGTTGTATITVSGTSITDAGVRATSDTEVLITDVTDAAQMAANLYHETTKKWIGAVTYTIATDGDRTTFNADFNVGLVKYEDFGNRDFVVRKFEAVGLAGATDSAFNLTLLHHSADNWTYHATAFVSPANPIVDMVTDYVTETELVNGEEFAYKRTGLSYAITGSAAVPTTTVSNGVVVLITTGTNAAVEALDVHIGITYPP
jgi:hypothetical protein